MAQQLMHPVMILTGINNGGLGIALRDNNYFVSDTYYGWGPDSIGDYTDIGHWWTWFRDSNSATYLSAIYNESNQSSTYSRLSADPGGENEIIMFKSCYPNSYLEGNPDDRPLPATTSCRVRTAGRSTIPSPTPRASTTTSWPTSPPARTSCSSSSLRRHRWRTINSKWHLERIPRRLTIT